jgi:hypothetical protein
MMPIGTPLRLDHTEDVLPVGEKVLQTPFDVLDTREQELTSGSFCRPAPDAVEIVPDTELTDADVLVDERKTTLLGHIRLGNAVRSAAGLAVDRKVEQLVGETMYSFGCR